MREHEMERYLRELLEGYRYLIVFYDLWIEEVWESLARALPQNSHGSRIIVTTRIKEVAELSSKRTYIHELRFLRPDESWELFCKKAFPDGCRQDLKMLGQEMVDKCGGLPLAVIVLGGLLSLKENVDEWQHVKNRIWRELKNKSLHISSLLELSYNDLPHQLQVCFLYLGLFPEDYVIDAEVLIQLWVAEDFIPDEEPEMEFEELAEAYLKELSGRSLIQVVDMKMRAIERFEVHDLLRDLLVNKAKELNFLHILDLTKPSSARRIVFHGMKGICASLEHSNKQVRTLAFINNFSHTSVHDDSVNMVMELIGKRFNSLKVLELQAISNLASTEGKFGLYATRGKMTHLKYLGLSHGDLNEFPQSIGNLHALQTLQTSCVLTKEFCKLKQLRNLLGQFEIKGGNMSPALFGELRDLRCVKTMNINGWLKENGVFSLQGFSNLQKLKILSLEFECDYQISLEPLLSCSGLLELDIYGKIEGLPKDIHKFLPKLKYLALHDSDLFEDPMPVLELLPNLFVLELDILEMNTMSITSIGFPRLEKLVFSSTSNLTFVQIEEGAIPKLKYLYTDDDSKRLLFPERLSCLPRYELIRGMTKAYENQLAMNE